MQNRLDSVTISPSPAARDDEAAMLRGQRERLEAFVQSQRQRLSALRESLSQHADGADRGGADEVLAELKHALDQAWAERDGLAQQLAERDEQLEQRRRETESVQQELWTLSQQDEQRKNEPGGEGSRPDERLEQELEDLRRRHELAMDDLKTAQARCAELQGKFAEAPSDSENPAPTSGLDWEAQKQQLLASLESDFDDDNEEDRRERLDIQEVIRKTEEAVAAKDGEIADLQRLLEEQSANFGSMAVGAAAVAEVLDKDEIIQQERKNLELLQDEWKDKLRQAEVEISVQRAKLARSQMELEEKSRQLERELRNQAPGKDAPQADISRADRWLRRLGIKGEE